VNLGKLTSAVKEDRAQKKFQVRAEFLPFHGGFASANRRALQMMEGRYQPSRYFPQIRFRAYGMEFRTMSRDTAAT
jgi:hypothetical protein